MGANALRWDLSRVGIIGRGRGEGSRIRVFDDFELVLLVRVEEAVEGCGREMEGFSYEGGEGAGEGGHLGYVGFVGWAEGGDERWGRPLIRGKEVVVERRGGEGERMRG